MAMLSDRGTGGRGKTNHTGDHDFLEAVHGSLSFTWFVNPGWGLILLDCRFRLEAAKMIQETSRQARVTRRCSGPKAKIAS
jgi:hypothetical protein